METTHRVGEHPSVLDLLCTLLPNTTVTSFSSLSTHTRNSQLPELDTAYTKNFHTTRAPSERDVRAVTEILHWHQALLDDVTIEINFIELIMKHFGDIHRRLLDKRDHILASMKTHQGIFSSIRRLPTDILRVIFLQCLPAKMYIEPNTRTAPLTLINVCREWRQVAFNTPRLWCSLSIRPSCWSIMDVPSFYRPWLDRARGLPLALEVDSRQSLQNLSWSYEMFTLMVRHCSHISRLRIMSGGFLRTGFLAQQLPVLEDLTLEGGLSSIYRFDIDQPEPRLRSLTLDGVREGTSIPSTLNFDWAHLTQLRINFGPNLTSNLYHDPDNHCIVLLSLCPHLQCFALSPEFIAAADLATPRALTHTHLRSLNVGVLQGLGYLLDTLTLPELRHLEVRDLRPSPSTGWRGELEALVARSQCTLETLRIYSGQGMITQDAGKEYAALFPTLKHFDLSLVEQGVQEQA